MTEGSGKLGDVLAPLATPHGQGWLRRAVWLLAVAQVLSLVVVGAHRPARPHLLDPAGVAPALGPVRLSRVAGFGQVGFRVVSAQRGGSGRTGCALLAETPQQQRRGLMARRDLAGYDAMVFRFATDTSVPFYNKGVPVALSIGWFDAAGVYVGQADLAVCDTACPLAAAGQPFRYAVETAKGGLGHLGIGRGSVLRVGGNCA